MADIGAVGSVSTSRAEAPRSAASAAPATSGPSSTDGGAPKASTVSDGFHASAELEDDEHDGASGHSLNLGQTLGNDNSSSPSDKAANTKDASAADQAKKAAEEAQQKEEEQKKKMEELDRKIEDTQKQLHEAITHGDQKKAKELDDQLNGLLSDRTLLQQEMEQFAGGQGPRPGASGAQHGGTAPGTVPAQGGAPQGGAPVQGAGLPAGMPMGGAMPMGGQGGAWPSGMMQGGAGNPAGVSANTSNPVPPLNLQGNDKKTADFINNYLASKGSPAAGQQAGELMVAYGKQYKVDPLILLSIAGQETQFGKTGIGANGMLGVGAYDSDPNNATRNPTFSGVANQIRIGAETFAKLRAKGGSSDQDSIANQAAAVNRAGWATDPNWHNGVTAMYAQVSRAAEQTA